MKTITTCLEKGGSAKTTTNNSLGAALALRGYKVLFVDLDPQMNLSQTLRADLSGLSSYEVLTEEADIREAIQKVGENISILPSSRRASKTDRVLGDEQGREYRLREALEEVSGDYDYCLIDTPPALGLLTMNALTASQSVVIPCQTEIYPLEAIKSLYKTIQSVRKYSNPDLEIEGILLTRYKPRTTLSKLATERAEEIAEEIETKVFDTKIRDTVVIQEAQSVYEDIFSYAPKSKIALDYSAFTDELLGVMK